MADDIDTSVFSDAQDMGVSLANDAGPWPRFWARVLDMNLGALGFGFLLGMAAPQLFTGPTFQGQGGTALLSIVLLPFSMVGDALSNALFGNTLGKLAAGIKIAPVGGGKIGASALIKRNAFLYVLGLAGAIPVANLAAFAFGFSKVSDKQPTYWDKQAGTRVISKGSNLGRTVLAAVLVIVIVVGGVMASV